LPSELTHDVSSNLLVATTTVVGRNETASFSFTPRVMATRYDDPAEVDRNDESADFGLVLAGARQTWSFGASYVNEGTLRSDFETIGFSALDVNREQTSANVGWSRPAEHGSFDAGIGATAVDYADVALSPFSNNRSQDLQGGYTRRLNERTSLRFSLAHMRIETDAGHVATVSDDVRVRWSHSFSEVLSASVGAGALKATTDVRGGATAETLGTLERTTPAVDFGVNRRWAYWQFSAIGSRTIEPDGRGTVLLDDSVEVSFSRRVGQRLDLGFSVRAGQISTAGVLYDHNFSAEGVTLHWAFKRRWALDGLFQERAEKWALRPGVNGFASYLSIAYRGS